MIDERNTGILAVQGAGTTGHGTAAVAVLSGCDIRLRGITAEVVQHGHEQIDWRIERWLIRNDIRKYLRRAATKDGSMYE